MIDLSDLLLPAWIPMIVTLIAAILTLKIQDHPRNLRLMHFIGRFYIFLIYFSLTFNIFGANSVALDDLQALLRSAITLLMIEEIISWAIERYWPRSKRG